MKHYDTVKRVYRVGQPVQQTGMINYQFPLGDASKDLLREGARREGMVGYSNASTEAMREYLTGRDVRSLVFRLMKANA
jgi:hypothetical protein